MVPGINLLKLGVRAQEAEDIKMGLTPMKIQKIDAMLAEWKSTVEQRWRATDASFKTLGQSVVYPGDLLPNVNYMTPRQALAPIHHSVLQKNPGHAGLHRSGANRHDLVQRDEHHGQSVPVEAVPYQGHKRMTQWAGLPR
ncbi:hypothetical protein QZH46_29070 [Pseudomonas corrugata]